MVKAPSLSGQSLRVGLERFSELPNGPGDAGHLVGHGGCCLVVTATRLEIEGPTAEAVGIGLGLSALQDSAGAVDEQHPEVNIALFADSAQTPPPTAGAFPGCET
jgi:hypothetical protein